MKKNYILLLLALMPYLGFSQLVTNNTFDANINGWTANGSGTTVTHTTAAGEFNNGPGAMKLIAGAAAGRAQSSPNTVPSTAGDYLVTSKVKGTAGTTIQIIVFQTGNTKTGTAQTLTGGWDTVSFLATGLDATNTANVRFVAGSASTYFIDDVYFTYQIPPGSQLTTAVTGAGTVAKSPDQISYPSPTNVTVTATPATHWVFNNWSGDLTGSTNPDVVALDGTNNKSVTANFGIDPAFNYAFLFNTDGNAEGWSTDPQLTATVTGGIATLTPTANQFARFSLTGFPINPATYNKVTIKLKNNSATSDQLGIIVTNNSAVTNTTTYAMSVSDAGYQTYAIPLNTIAAWTGSIVDFRIRIADEDNPTSGRPSDAGTILIDEIVFSYDSTLSTSSFESDSNAVSVYPNPVQNTLNVASGQNVSSVAIYNMLGQNVASQAGGNEVNVSVLKSGIYVAKVTLENGAVVNERFIKE
ncbi:T9SS type A sorting domain-containing protein [Flavobacterium sp. NG2]|uniref:T9SS type A sorting domain-containing protein n=1 Tax=Flavobacterium sp. NG2 TaxID=3097547 RepID=UPI002A8019E1|nr:T9SS type A sorting domain-containing protein [Flavobacterium sp. NG2]WPR71976.1 T9SS type A sorting domain-containing protein [Flavobacterium sp. NG2]